MDIVLLCIEFGVLACAVIGFVQLVKLVLWLAKLILVRDSAAVAAVDKSNSEQPTLEGDVAAAKRLVDYLHSQAQLDASDRTRILDFLQRRINEEGIEPLPDLSASAAEQSPSENPIVVAELARESLGRASEDETPQSTALPAEGSSPAIETSTVSESLAASELPTANRAAEDRPQQPPAPWDLPDPPPHTPRRSIQEVLAGFMEERNMRWGELTSGLLIVLSAVGLVVSLRDQLSDRIPYFSALLFMLITAAIHGAGIYTLKKWKLKNTSRGALIIGLLLIPVNFFAACLLNGQPGDRAELSDPWFWIAIVIGMAVFGSLTWWSSKLLFKKGIWPIVASLLGIGGATVLINRTITPAVNSTTAMVVAIPVVVFLLIGSLAGSKGLWSAKQYVGRAATRIYTFLALVCFAMLSATALMMARSESALVGLVQMLPTLTTAGIATTWIGLSTQPRVRGSHVSADTREQYGLAALVSVTLQILGAAVAVASIMASISNPSVALVSSTLGAVLLAALAITKRKAFLLPLAWTLAGFGALLLMLVLTEKLPLNDWVQRNQLVPAFVSAPTALFLVASAICATAATLLLGPASGRLGSARAFKLAGFGSAAVAMVAGVVLSVLASLMQPGQWFEVTVASVLLSSLSAVAVFVHVRLLGGVAANPAEPVASATNTETSNREQASSVIHLIQRFQLSAWVPLATVLVLVTTLAHVLVWDQRVSQWLTAWVGETRLDGLPVVHGIVIALTTGLTMSLLAYAAVRRPSNALLDASPEHTPDPSPTAHSSATAILKSFANASCGWASLALVAATAASLLCLMPLARGWATALLLIATASWLVIGVVHQRLSRRSSRRSSESGYLNFDAKFSFLPATVSATIAASVLVTEVALSRIWISQLFDSQHGFLIALTLAGVATLLSTVRIASSWTQKKHWLTSAWRLEYVLIAAATLMLGVLLMDQIGRGIAHEIFGDRAWAAGAMDGSLLPEFNSISVWLPWLALAVVGLAVVAAWFQRPNHWLGECLILIWFLGWAFAATGFGETRAVATAIRWLVPLGGILLAVALSLRGWLGPVWGKLRAGSGQPGRSLLRPAEFQQLVNSNLALATLAVLGISTLTTGQVLLNSPQSLGGPLANSIFKTISVEANFGIPLVIVVATFLLLGITQRRRWLATGGSGVFQFVVLLALYFLAASPHEQLASQWFAGILQTVSISMTIYGLVWYFFQRRVDDDLPSLDEASVAPRASRHLQVHTLLNGALLTGIAAVVLTKVFYSPTVSMGWSNAFGSLLGLISLGIFAGLTVLVWRRELLSIRSPFAVTSLMGWAGVVCVGLLVARFDRVYQDAFVPWSNHRWASIGFLLVGVAQVIAMFWTARSLAMSTQSLEDEVSWDQVPLKQGESLASRIATAGAVACVGTLGCLAALQGLDAFAGIGPAIGSWFWLYAAVVGGWAALSLAIGLYSERSLFGFVSSAIASANLYWICQANPNGWIPHRSPAWLNSCILVSALIGTVWTAWVIYRHRCWRNSNTGLADGRRPSKLFSLFPTIMMLLGALWLVLGSLTESMLLGGNWTALTNWIGLSAFAAVGVLLLVHSLGNPDARGRVLAWVGITLSAAGTLVSLILEGLNDYSVEWYLTGWAIIVAIWGVGWSNRRRVRPLIASTMAGSFGGNTDHASVTALSESFGRKLPVFSLVVSLCLGGCAAAILIFSDLDSRVSRFALAVVPLWCAYSFANQSNAGQKRWLQMSCLTGLTSGAVLVTFAQLAPAEITASKLVVRAFSVLGASMFIYGGLVSRWVRPGDRWLQSLKEMSVVVCGTAVLFLIAVIGIEASQFEPAVGCGLSRTEAIGTAVIIVGMIVGLILLALRPENDPFSLSLKGRMVYVYVAQLVAVALVAHLYFSAPWLFQFGLRKFWPFVVMAICFIGVVVAELLKKQNLTVLAVPLFNVASILPVLVAAMSFLDSYQIATSIRPATIMLTIGLMYLAICYIRKTVVSGALCVVFGNAALWLFLHHYPAMAFLEHPQLWLIPPAACVLIASQLIQDRLRPEQLTMIRYVSAAVIYLSSTSEIFIRGIGDSLWPPMVLAAFAVAGILTGMLLRVRAFLYFGVLFLLMALLTMVSHAHQRFDHVWPWWVFGIGLGVMILVMFGLFEKRKNDLKQIAQDFKTWDN